MRLLIYKPANHKEQYDLWFMLPTILRRICSSDSYFVWLCGFYYETFHFVCLILLLVLMFLFGPVHHWESWTGLYEPRHDKTNKVSVRPAKTQISLGICPVWSESLLSAWRKLGSLDTHEVHSEDSDQTGSCHVAAPMLLVHLFVYPQLH